jgi:hypothetical protein
MTIGILNLTLYMPESHSLKAKRQILHSLKANLKNSFNIAVTQIDQEDKWQKAQLALVGVEKNRDKMNSILSRILNFIESFHQVQLVDHQIELL